MLQRIDPNLSGKVINKANKVKSASLLPNWCRASNIIGMMNCYWELHIVLLSKTQATQNSTLHVLIPLRSFLLWNSAKPRLLIWPSCICHNRVES